MSETTPLHVATSLNVQAVSEALMALGSAYRGDWSCFDGRSLRAQLDEMAAVLNSDTPVTYAQLCLGNSVCPVERCWYEHCSEVLGMATCRHVEAGSS